MKIALQNSLVTLAIALIFFATTFGAMNKEITSNCLMLVVGICALKYVYQSYPSAK